MLLHLVFPQAPSRKGRGKALRKTPTPHSSSRATRKPALRSPCQPQLAARQHGGIHRGSRAGVRIPGSSPPVCPSPPPALPMTKSFSDCEPQSQPRQGKDRSGPPISQSSTLPQLQCYPQGQNCLDIPLNGPCPTLHTPCQQALGLIFISQAKFLTQKQPGLDALVVIRRPGLLLSLSI